MKSWVDLTPRARVGRMELFCLPHVGAGSTVFSALAQILPATVRVRALRAPGRESRVAEAPHRNMSALVDEIGSDMEATLGAERFALVGICSGAIVAFELTRWLQRRGLSPAALVAAGSEAPRVPIETSLHTGSREALVENLREGGTDPAVLASAEMLDTLEPVIRADYEVLETWRYRPGPPIRCPVVCVIGKDELPLPNVAAWAHETTARFELVTLPQEPVRAQLTPEWARALGEAVLRATARSQVGRQERV